MLNSWVILGRNEIQLVTLTSTIPRSGHLFDRSTLLIKHRSGFENGNPVLGNKFWLTCIIGAVHHGSNGKTQGDPELSSCGTTTSLKEEQTLRSHSWESSDASVPKNRGQGVEVISHAGQEPGNTPKRTWVEGPTGLEPCHAWVLSIYLDVVPPTPDTARVGSQRLQDGGSKPGEQRWMSFRLIRSLIRQIFSDFYKNKISYLSSTFWTTGKRKRTVRASLTTAHS